MGESLKLPGAQFDICAVTLQNLKPTTARFINSATYVPSGVAALARLKQRAGYAYVKP